MYQSCWVMRPQLRQAWRYGRVGLLCALLNNAVVMAMDHAGFHYAICVTAAFLIVMAVAYLLHTTYTFNVPATPGGWIRFTAANIVGFPLAMGIMAALCDGLRLSASVAIVIATAIQFCFNYALARWLLVGGTGSAGRHKGMI